MFDKKKIQESNTELDIRDSILNQVNIIFDTIRYNNHKYKFSKLKIVAAMDKKEANGASLGIWYGIKVQAVCDTGVIGITNITVAMDYDGCFVSDMAVKRRLSTLRLNKSIAEFVKDKLEEVLFMTGLNIKIVQEESRIESLLADADSIK